MFCFVRIFLFFVCANWCMYGVFLTVFEFNHINMYAHFTSIPETFTIRILGETVAACLAFVFEEYIYTFGPILITWKNTRLWQCTWLKSVIGFRLCKKFEKRDIFFFCFYLFFYSFISDLQWKRMTLILKMYSNN